MNEQEITRVSISSRSGSSRDNLHKTKIIATKVHMRASYFDVRPHLKFTEADSRIRSRVARVAQVYTTVYVVRVARESSQSSRCDAIARASRDGDEQKERRRREATEDRGAEQRQQERRLHGVGRGAGAS